MFPVALVVHGQVHVALRVLVAPVVAQPHIVALVGQKEGQRVLSQADEVRACARDAVQQEDRVSPPVRGHVYVGDAIHRQDVTVLGGHVVFDHGVAALVDDFGLEVK